MSRSVSRAIVLIGLFVGFGSLLINGCYSPKLGTPGFYCHEGDNPACPDGQMCLQGRCVAPGTHVVPSSDLGMNNNGGDDLAGNNNNPVDMAHSSGNKDFSTNHPPDLSQPNTGMTGCNGLLNCLNACAANDQTCANNCFSNTTSQGQSLFMTAQQCALSNCPNMSPGDPCYDPSDPTGSCSQCIGQYCSNEVNACTNDLP